MAYTDDAVRVKLASLNETQESVVNVAQWIMFHRRHADRTVNLWLSRLREVSTSKRLNLIYLANEVVQQSRARSKTDFLLAFEPIIAEATALAFKSADSNVREKVRRVVDVWRERNIFDGRIQEGIESQIRTMDEDNGVGSKSTSGGIAKGKRGRLGGGLFSGSSGVPSELDGAAGLVSSLREMQDGLKTKVGKANEDFAKMVDPNNPVPTPPVHAARLSALGKTLASAQGAVEASMKARSNLITQLESLVQNHRKQFENEETIFANLKTKREGTDAKKNEVEDGIMRGLSTPSSPDILTPTNNNSNSSFAPNTNGNDSLDDRRELDQPETEDFTPPPEDRSQIPPEAIIGEDDTIPSDPRIRAARNSFTSPTGAESIREQPPNFNEPPPSHEPPPALPVKPSNAAAAAEQFLSSLTANATGLGQVRQASQEIPNGGEDPRLKRRKLSHQSPSRTSLGLGLEEEFATGIDAGVDDEGISALLQ